MNQTAKKILTRIISLIGYISTIIFCLSLTYLFLKYPLNIYNFPEWVNRPAISNYGQIPYTENFFNTFVAISGILFIFNAIYVVKKLDIEDNPISVPYIISSIGFLGIAIFPMPMTSINIIPRAIHWSFALLAIVVYPYITSMIVRRLKPKFGKFLQFTILLTYIIAVYVYIKTNKSMFYPEIVLAVSVLFSVISINILANTDLRHKKNKKKALKNITLWKRKKEMINKPNKKNT